MSHQGNTNVEESIRDQREDWLSENGVKESDVIEDRNGEYFIDLVENGNPQDDYQIDEKKVYLPTELTLKWI